MNDPEITVGSAGVMKTTGAPVTLILVLSSLLRVWGRMFSALDFHMVLLLLERILPLSGLKKEKASPRLLPASTPSLLHPKDQTQ